MTLLKTPLQYAYDDTGVIRPGRHASPIVCAMQPHLRHVWHLDESSDGSAPVVRSDSHGTNHLADNNAITSASGKRGNGANITRPSSAEYLQGAEIARGASSVLISFWVKFDSLAADGEWHVLAQEDTSSTGYFRFQLARRPESPTKLTMQWRSAGLGTGYTATSTAEFAVDTWYHVVALFDTVNDRLRAVVNGVEWINSSQTGMQAAADEASASGLRIGNYTAYDRVRPADGIIDEFEIWHDVVPSDLSSVATALHNAGAGDFYEFGQTSRVQIHDAELAYCDAGLGRGWQPSTFSAALAGNAAISSLRVYWSNNAGDTPTYASYSPAAFAALPDQSCRYMWLQVDFSGATPADSLDALSISTRSLDLTPPSEPPYSAAYRISDGDLERLYITWTNGLESGLAGWRGTVCEVEIAGAWYAREAAGWAPAATATPEYVGAESERVSRDLDPDDETVLGVSIADATRVRLTSHDQAGNTASLVLPVTMLEAFPEAPPAPEIVGVAAGDGTLTVTIEPALTTDEVWLLHGELSADAALSSPVETLKRIGSGAITIPELENGVTRVLLALTRRGGLWSAPGETVLAMPSDSGAALLEVRQTWRARLLSHAPLTALLGSSNAVRLADARRLAQPPEILLAFRHEPTSGTSALDQLDLDVTHTLVARSEAELDALTDALAAALEGFSSTGSAWSIRAVRLLNMATEEEESTSPGTRLLQRRVRYGTRLLRLSGRSTIRLAAAAETLTLPAPCEEAVERVARAGSSAVSADGTRYVYDGGVQSQRSELHLTGLSAAEKDALTAFFHARGGTRDAFDYTDAGGTARAAKFGSSRLEFARRGADCWDARVPLEIGSA